MWGDCACNLRVPGGSRSEPKLKQKILLWVMRGYGQSPGSVPDQHWRGRGRPHTGCLRTPLSTPNTYLMAFFSLRPRPESGVLTVSREFL